MDRRVNIFRDLEITDHTDVRGRLVAEDAAEPAIIQQAEAAGVSMKRSIAHYPATRFGRAINLAALKSMYEHWDDLSNGLVWIHRQYFGDNSPQEEIDGKSFSDLTAIGAALPMYCFLKQDNPVDRHGELPVSVATISKACRGLAQAANLYADDDQVTTQAIHEDVENNGLFISPNGMVCAAPWKLIDQSIDALCFGKGAEGKSDVADYVPDFKKLTVFSKAYLEALDLRNSIQDTRDEYHKNPNKNNPSVRDEWYDFCWNQRSPVKSLHRKLRASLR